MLCGSGAGVTCPLQHDTDPQPCPGQGWPRAGDPRRREWGDFVLFRNLLPAAEKRVAVGEGQQISSSNIFWPLSCPSTQFESCVFSELPCSNLWFNKT